MIDYTYRCPKCGLFDESHKMGTAPETTMCECGREAKRQYGPVPIHYRARDFTQAGKHDRPDERLKAEVEHSKDFDRTTGKSWEQTEREEERKRAHYGELMKKEFVLPAEGQGN